MTGCCWSQGVLLSLELLMHSQVICYNLQEVHILSLCSQEPRHGGISHSTVLSQPSLQLLALFRRDLVSQSVLRMKHHKAALLLGTVQRENPNNVVPHRPGFILGGVISRLHSLPRVALPLSGPTAVLHSSALT